MTDSSPIAASRREDGRFANASTNRVGYNRRDRNAFVTEVELRGDLNVVADDFKARRGVAVRVKLTSLITFLQSECPPNQGYQLSVPLFDKNFLTRLEYLSLVSRKVFQGELMAQRRTTKTGGGVEFADHRQYSTGDDFRYLDWNLYARHGELLLKRFQEEEDLHVYILLDCSRSMGTPDSRRFDLARQITAALAYIAMSDLDRVAVFAFADGILQHFPLTRGKERILALMEWLERLEVSGQATSLNTLSRQFVQQTPRKGMVIVLSDFYDVEGFEPGLDLLRHHKFEPCVIQLHTAEEASPQLLGDVELVDAETNDFRKLTVTEAALKRYQERFDGFLESLTKYCVSYGISCTISKTEMTFDDLMLAMMRSNNGPLGG